MRRVETRVLDARAALADLGLPAAQHNELAALTLLALAGLTPRDHWADVSAEPTRPHDILAFINKHYGRDYKENTRETVRRQVLHQFAQAAIAVLNADDPGRATNSPNSNYRLSTEAADVLKLYGSLGWDSAAKAFRERCGTLSELYRKPRLTVLRPVTLPGGQTLRLSPGAHNELQAAVVEEFGPRFVPGAEVLYFGDTAKKNLYVATGELEGLGVPVTDHDKLADIVLVIPDKGALVLVEVVTSHGPVSPKRWEELEALLSECRLKRVYVSAFPTFTEFKRHMNDIAWETEVWVAEVPDHMIHFNGEKFLHALR
jgi:hypothetical protein